ncbi:hypothetical protein N9B81_00540 [bacterium]|nr:hypothetical protein [bacterium]
MSWWWLIVAVVVVGLFGLYLSMTAGRLDALHKRIDTSELSLDAQLVRRSSIALELATSGLLDPAGAIVVAEAAHAARTAADGDTSALDRAEAESALTQALDATLDDEEVEEVRAGPGGAELIEELAASAQRVQLSRRFLNDAVRACSQLRRQRMVRWFRLAGHTPWPTPVELDDSVPAALAGS